MREIGSEFWSIDIDTDKNNIDYLKIAKDNKLLMSGRSAIDFVIKDINISNGIVYMPNYCCESMVEPFISNSYNIEYYDVDIINNKYIIDMNKECDIFFAMSYFGYNKANMDKYIKNFARKNIIVIEDITHRLLCNNNYCKESTYLVASLRKWFPIITGGIAICVGNKFNISTNSYSVNKELIKKRRLAMDLKRDYLNGLNVDKERFLKLYSDSNNMFKKYSSMKIDELSLDILKKIDIDRVKNTRINNTEIIEKMLDNSNIKLLYKLEDGDCPLFVPVLLDNRDIIRKKLIDNNIYLPIHWPNFNNFNNDIYNLELSLVCDQRYNNNDIIEYMDKLIDIVGE